MSLQQLTSPSARIVRSFPLPAQALLDVMAHNTSAAAAAVAGGLTSGDAALEQGTLRALRLMGHHAGCARLAALLQGRQRWNVRVQSTGARGCPVGWWCCTASRSPAACAPHCCLARVCTVSYYCALPCLLQKHMKTLRAWAAPA